jgi:hypothetical protein
MSYSSQHAPEIWFDLDPDDVPFDPVAEKKAALNMLSAAVHIALSHADADEVFATIDKAAWHIGKH